MFSLAQSSKAEATRQDAWPSAPQDAAKHILMVPESVMQTGSAKWCEDDGHLQALSAPG